jgi:hypothetical protein
MKTHPHGWPRKEKLLRREKEKLLRREKIVKLVREERGMKGRGWIERERNRRERRRKKS